MPLTNPSELQKFLESLGIHPKKGLSQNFLIDGNIVRKIVATAAIKPGDSVLEIGPGPGALTEALLEAGASLTAVEKDRVYAKALSRFERVQAIEGDILEFDLDQLPKGSKVVSNLPYQLTSPILARLLPRHDLFSSVTVMVQEEVARRMVGKPSTPDYSSFTLFVNFYTRPLYAFFVSHNCFYPRPKVDSAVVHFVLKPPPSDIDPPIFFKFVRTAFGQRRKMLRRSLKELCGGSETVEAALNELQLNPLARPENLSLEAFILLFQKLKNFFPK